MAKSTQRRLAAVVAADVVGYSRLMARDEEGTLAAVKAIHQDVFNPLFDEHGGRVVKTTGDGLLAEFPSVLDAVRCCVDVQDQLADQAASMPEDRRLRFRIGINLGDIIIEDDDIYGDGVNVAARLESMAEPGGICVSDDVVRQIRGKLDVPFTDDGRHALKNIPEPVHVWRWSLGTSTKLAIVDVSEPVPGFDGRPAIAVLPFNNLSQDPEQEFLADGIAEDILTRLAMWRWLPVIARNSSFSFKGQAIDVKKVGQELGARYILEGSVRKAGNRVRITGQLIDTESGHHVWADRFDNDLNDVFALQDDIADAVVTALEPAVGRAEMHRAQRKSPTSIDAWTLYQHGRARLVEATREGLDSARDLFQRSFNADPGFAPPYAGTAIAHFVDKTIGYTANSEAMMEAAHELALKAVSLDDLDPLAHAGLAYSSIQTGNHDLAVAAGRRATELNPSFALGHHALFAALYASGEHDEAVEVVSKAIRISPNDPWLFLFLAGLSASLYMQRNYTGSAETSGKAVQRFPWYPSALRWHAVALAQLERHDEAREALAKFLELSPSYSMDSARKAYVFRRQVDLDHFLDGHQKAGLGE